MTPDSKSPLRLSEGAFEAFADEAARAELERIEALTPEELRAELLAYGAEAESASPSGAALSAGAAPLPSSADALSAPITYAYDAHAGDRPSEDPRPFFEGRALTPRGVWQRMRAIPLVYVAAAGVLAILVAHYLRPQPRPDVAHPLPPAPDPTEIEPKVNAPEAPPSIEPAPAPPPAGGGDKAPRGGSDKAPRRGSDKGPH